jgi:uncharacterized protein (TIGR02118 family)
VSRHNNLLRAWPFIEGAPWPTILARTTSSFVEIERNFQGGVRAMIKFVFTIRRRPDMSREEFQRYWFENHGALIKRHTETLQIRRYVQTHARETSLDAALANSRGSEARYYDGVAELWWDSLEDLMAAFSTAAGQAAAFELLEDERRFIDLPNSPMWLGEELVVIGD